MSWQEWAMDANVYDDREGDYSPPVVICSGCGLEMPWVKEGEDEVICPNCGEVFDPFPEPPDSEYYLDGIW